MSVITGGSVIAGAGRRIINAALGSPALGATSAVHAAINQPASGTTVVTTAITNPDVPRNVTITGNQSSCTGNVVIAGTDAEGASINETIALNGTATVAGNKAFKTVVSITVPARGDTGDTVVVGTGAKLGLGKRLGRNSVVAAFLNGVREATAPTVAFDATNMSGNTVTLNSALASQAVLVDHYDS